MKKRIAIILIKILNPVILWCFGWKRIRKTYFIRDIPVDSEILWRDPLSRGAAFTEPDAIQICERRITKGK